MSVQLITDLLKQVNYPGFSRDIVSFGLIRETQFENGLARIKLEIVVSDPTLPKKLKDEIENTLLANEEIKKVEQEINLVKKILNIESNDQKN